MSTYSGSQLLATIEGGATKYHLRDHLSTRVTVNSTGGAIGTQGHLPFGEPWYDTSATATNSKFTSYERDAESGNDYAMARYYVNRLGRFNAPDPISGSVADPQSLNRYAYVRNNPVNLIDPTGLTEQPVQPADLATDWDRMPTWMALFLGQWFGNPFEMNMALHGAITAEHFGDRFGDLPGMYNGAAEGERRHRAMMLKKALEKLFRENRECADLLGGQPRAIALAQKAVIKDVSASTWRARTWLDREAVALGWIDRVRSGESLAATRLYTTSPGGPWNRRAFAVYVGDPWWNLTPTDAQLTQLIHELAHPAHAGKLSADELDQQFPYERISRVCNTPLP